MIKFLAVIISMTLISSCTKNTEVKPVDSEEINEVVAEQQITRESTDLEQNTQIEISGDLPKPINKKFTIEDQNIISRNVDKPIMIAVIAPMSGQYDMLGNAIMDGAHMGLIDLFNQHKIAIRLTAIDIGSKIEDIEFNLSKLDETQFDIILGLTSEAQKTFVEAYIAHMEKKPKIMSFLEDDCSISPRDQMTLIQGRPIYVILPKNEEASRWQSDNNIIIHYDIDNVQKTTDDLMKIAQKINEETREKDATVVFTDGNWKLQRFMANIDILKMSNRINIVLASLSHKNNRMESINQKRHRFGNISIIDFNTPHYDNFMNEFYSLHKRKPLDIAFLAYNTVHSLVNLDKDDQRNFDIINCKPNIKLFDRNE